MAPINIFRFTASRVAIPRRTARLTASTRPLHQTTISFLPRKTSQDKDSIDNEATEYTKSGTDDEAARQGEAAFNPNETDPAKEKSKAGEGNSGNPLEVSAANPDVSKQAGKEKDGGAEDSAADGRKKSGYGSPNKGKKV